MEKSADAFRTISEVADDLSLPQHVLRFWETRFPQVRPLKRAGGRRYYRPADVLLLRTIRQLLYDDGYTIKGVQRLLKEQGAKGLSAAAGDLQAGAVADLAAADLQRLDGDMPVRPPIMAAADNLLVPDGDDVILSHAHRDAIEVALAAVEECERLLAALRRPASARGI